MWRWIAGMALSTSVLQAVDGIVLIDQNRAMAGNVTPGDAPGFPVSINVPGSYRLSGNLTLPSAAVWAIEVTSHVTLDLNGFAILGPVNCAGGSCVTATATGDGGGIRVIPPSQFNITIRNGTIQGTGGEGVFLTGGSFIVEDLRVRSNWDTGILVRGLAGFTAGAAIIRANTSERNGGKGISSESGIIADNTVQENFGAGIRLIPHLGRLERNVIHTGRVGIAPIELTSTIATFSNVVSVVGGGCLAFETLLPLGYRMTDDRNVCYVTDANGTVVAKGTF